MKQFRLTDMETKFADIIWKNEPIDSPILVKLCEQQLDWKKSTTYTMLRRIAEKGIFENRNGTVYALIKKEDFYSMQSQEYIDEVFQGSLPRFFTAFTRGKRLSNKEINELQKLIDEHKE